MDYLVTPDERFADLPGYGYSPNYVVVDDSGMSMHYVDEGPREAPVVLLLHGEPSWSYLYRHMIPVLLDAGLRVLAPDLIGFGRSAKPTRVEDHSYARHMEWLTNWTNALSLQNATLFGQDWGSLLGLRLIAEQESRFSAAMISNGYLPVGEPPAMKNGGWKNALAFLTWRSFAMYSPVFPTSRIVDMGSARTLTEDERRAYDAPFPDRRYQAGARAFPALVPLSHADPAREANLAAWRVLEQWEKPFVTAFSTGDPIMRGLDKALQSRIPGTKGQDHTRVRGGHFVQEDSGPELARRLAALALSAAS